jgi:DNA-binding CsgD family transcriptional regulator
MLCLIASALGIQLRSNLSEPRERRSGRPPSGMAPSKRVLLRLYAEEGKSIREIGEILNCSKDMVMRALKAHEIEARANTKRSRLRGFPKEDLLAQVSEKGVRSLARELGIHENTLRNYLKTA